MSLKIYLRPSGKKLVDTNNVVFLEKTEMKKWISHHREYKF